jgi:hypothetical protein
MKIKILTIIFTQVLFVNLSLSQKIIDDIYVPLTSYSSESFVFFDNSTFIYEIGTENKSKITIGTFTKNNDLFVLNPFKLDKIKLIENQKSIDNRIDAPIKTLFIFNDGDTSELEVKYTTRETATKWTNSVIDTDSLKKIESNDITNWKQDNFVWSDYRINNDSIAVCLISIEKLINKRIVFYIAPNYSKLEIHINAPIKLAFFINNYECSYSEMLNREFILKDKKIRVENFD